MCSRIYVRSHLSSHRHAPCVCFCMSAHFCLWSRCVLSRVCSHMCAFMCAHLCALMCVLSHVHSRVWSHVCVHSYGKFNSWWGPAFLFRNMTQQVARAQPSSLSIRFLQQLVDHSNLFNRVSQTAAGGMRKCDNLDFNNTIEIHRPRVGRTHTHTRPHISPCFGLTWQSRCLSCSQSGPCRKGHLKSMTYLTKATVSIGRTLDRTTWVDSTRSTPPRRDHTRKRKGRVGSSSTLRYADTETRYARYALQVRS